MEQIINAGLLTNCVLNKPRLISHFFCFISPSLRAKLEFNIPKSGFYVSAYSINYMEYKKYLYLYLGIKELIKKTGLPFAAVASVPFVMFERVGIWNPA